MSIITFKKSRTRCVICKRPARAALSEQAARKEPCPTTDCDFLTEIRQAIEDKPGFKIIPVEKKKINITEKQKPKIEIIKKR